MRANGGVIGAINLPTTTAAPGIWQPSFIARQLGAPISTLNTYWPTLKDASFANVSLLCHFDVSTGNGVANKGNGVGVARSGSAGVSIDQRKFRGYSGFINTTQSSTADGFSSVSNAAYNYGSGDFTIEFWIYPLTNSAGVIWDQRPTSTSGFYPTLYFASAGNINFYTNSADRITGASALVTVNVWHHIALCKASGSTKLFVDGVQNGSTYTDGNTYLQSNIWLGNSGFAQNANIGAYLQECRATKGVGRYTAGFTVPSAPFADY